MTVRAFSGSGDFITLGIGDIVNSGGATMLVLCNLTAGGGWRSTIDISSGTDQRVGMQASDSNLIHYIAGTQFPSTGVSWGTAEGWVIVAISKASGTAAVRGHKYVFSSDTWTRDNGSAIGNATQGDTVRLGEMASFNEFFPGRIAAAAVWSRAMSDAEMDGLVSDIQSWLDAGPDALWLLTQESTATAVVDVTGGGADQTAITGTSVVTDDDPPGFDLTLGGAGELTGSGDVVAPAAQVAGTGTLDEVFIVGSGSVVASPATVTGAGNLPITGSGSVTASAAVVFGRETIPGPFIVGIDGLHFIDENGDPIAFNSDTVWALPVRAGQHGGGTTWQSDITNYMSIRGGQGYNAMEIACLGSTANAGPFNTGATWDEVLPFVDGEPGDLNEDYWERVDHIVAEAEANAMTVLMNIAYSDDLDNAALSGKTNTQLNEYGQALGTRYGGRPNIVWMVGGDYFGTFDTALDNILSGLRGAGDTHLISIQNYPETTSRRDLFDDSTTPWGNSNTEFNFVYTYNVTYFGIEYAYQESPLIPVIWGDGNYDQVNAAYRHLMRNQTWWALSSGSRGTNYGSEAIWAWGSGALAALTTGVFAASDLPTIIATFRTFPGWHLLLPDLDDSLITAGRGTRASSLPSGGGNEYNPGSTQDEFVSASVTPDGSLAVIYFPVAGEITVDDTELAAGYSARWVDPIDGASTPETVSSTYTTPGTNSVGDDDWVLVLLVTGDASGDGQADAPPAEVSGAGLVTVTGGGSTSAPSATVAGAGSVEVDGSAALLAPAALVSGTGTIGSVLVTGTGALTAPASTIAGTGAALVAGSGQATASPAIVAGIGNTGAAPITGSGQVTTAAATAAGVGTVSIDGSGAIVTPAAIIDGSGAIVITGMGTVAAPAANVSGAELPTPPIPDRLILLGLDDRLTLVGLEA